MPTKSNAKFSWIRFLCRLAPLVLIGYGLFLVVLVLLENRMIFFPSRLDTSVDWKAMGLTYEDAWFTTPDGFKIHGWYFPCAKPRAHILFAHGNAGNISDRRDLMIELQNRFEVSVLFFDYRGYGLSGGKPYEGGILEDARAARRWLAERVGVGEDEIVLMAESIGCGVMVDLAAKDGARGLVLESAYTSLPDVAAAAMPGLPVRWLMRTRLNALDKIGQYRGPLLQFHGSRDSIIPFALGRRLFEAANDPKQFVAIRGGDHNDPRGAQFFRELDAFLDRLPPLTNLGK